MDNNTANTPEVVKKGDDMVEVFYDNVDYSTGIITLDKHAAKQCAIICCDEILKVCNVIMVDFYQQVKQYITTK